MEKQISVTKNIHDDYFIAIHSKIIKEVDTIKDKSMKCKILEYVDIRLNLVVMKFMNSK